MSTETVTKTLTNSVKQAASRAGLSERSIRLAISDGRLRTVRIGTRVLIPESALRSFLGLKTDSREGADE